MKNIIYSILLLIFLSFSINWLIDYPVLQTIAGLGWCVAGFFFLRGLINYLLKLK
jgi:hypothetical protein